jgi:Ca2+-binding EF-hand superfamily protein
MIDKNHCGKINYSEFVTILYDRSQLHARQSMIEAFKYIDTNNDGYLQKEEIRSALKSIGYKELSSILT